MRRGVCRNSLLSVKYSAGASLNKHHPLYPARIMIVTANPQQWTVRQALPLHQRILSLPDEVRDFVHQVNVASGLDAVPVAAMADAGLRADLSTALLGMPAAVRALVDPLLLGICLGRNLGSSGVTDIVADAGGRILGCIVLLDIGLLEQHTANSWASWKENLPFQQGPGFSLTAIIADAAGDTRANALQFLLLHEFGHVLTADGDFLPRWWEPLPSCAASDARFAYLDLSWTITPFGRFAPRDDFPLRGQVDFYGNNKLEGDALITACAGLEASDFPSLYGATNPYDDFAECFASYVHSEMLGRPYVLRVDLDGEPQAYLDSFWAGARSDAKRGFMEAMLGVVAVPVSANDDCALVAA